MAIFITAADGTKYYMDAVFEVSYSQSGSPTKYAVESGVKSSDHYDQDQDTISMSGSVSAVKFLRNQTQTTDLETFEKGLTALKKSGQFFTVTFSDNLNPLTKCLFTSLGMSRNTTGGKYSIDVNISITQVVVAKQAGVVTTPVPLQQYEDIVAGGENSSTNTVAPTVTEQKKLFQIALELNPGTAVVFDPITGGAR